MTTRQSPKAETLWRERVAGWRASGESATEFSRQHGFNAGTLKWWAHALKKSDESARPRFVQLVPRAMPAAVVSEMVIEVAGARVRVTRGFDAALLSDVVRALHAGAR